MHAFSSPLRLPLHMIGQNVFSLLAPTRFHILKAYTHTHNQKIQKDSRSRRKKSQSSVIIKASALSKYTFYSICATIGNTIWLALFAQKGNNDSCERLAFRFHLLFTIDSRFPVTSRNDFEISLFALDATFGNDNNKNNNNKGNVDINKIIEIPM